MKKVQTWLPLFSGFYHSIWTSDDLENQEIDHINEEREKLGLEPIEWDDCTFDYDSYNEKVGKGITTYIERELKEFVSGIEFEEIKSPKEYNFRTDSINVIVNLTVENETKILAYLDEHSKLFAQYLKEKYTSRSGFWSHYPNDVDGFMSENPLEHKHKLGSILEFICNVEDITELNAYYNVEAYLEVSNYSELVPN